MKNLIQLLSIVMFDNNRIGIVIDTIKRGASQVDAVQIFDGANPCSGITINNSHVEVVNTNYINSGMNPIDIWLEYTKIVNAQKDIDRTKYEAAATTYQKQITEFTDKCQANLDTFQSQLAKAAKAKAANIKPAIKSAGFSFGGLYDTPIIRFEIAFGGVKTTLSMNNMIMNVGEIAALDVVCNTTIGGLKIAPDTIKIGKSIGYVSAIQLALDFYKSKK